MASRPVLLPDAWPGPLLRRLKNCYTHQCNPDDYEIDDYHPDEGEEGEDDFGPPEQFQWRVELVVFVGMLVLLVGVAASPWLRRLRYWERSDSIDGGGRALRPISSAENITTDYRQLP